MKEGEQEKLAEIASLATSLLQLKNQQSQLNEEKALFVRTKCDQVKKKRIEEHRLKSQELDSKEKELTKKTKQLVDELMDTCEDTPFHRALLNILKNLRGKWQTSLL